MDNFDLHSYDKYIVSFSGGKDSTALLLYLLDNSVPCDRIELWHQEIDGRSESLFDWEVTPDYCRKLGEAFGIPVFYQWRTGGFKKEMLRNNELTAPICFELPGGEIKQIGGIKGKPNTRLKFPQQSASLKVRWCSAALKIDVCSAALRNQERFRNIRTLVLSGERGEESKQRSTYAILEPDKADLRNGKEYFRHIDRYRPIRDWKESQIWDIMEKYRVRAHPCYFMGFGRCSCKFCVFGNQHQFASAACISKHQANDLIQFEKDFGYTLKRDTDLSTLIQKGEPYESITPELALLATSYEYNRSIIIPDGEKWMIPAGAFKKCGGAT